MYGLGVRFISSRDTTLYFDKLCHLKTVSTNGLTVAIKADSFIIRVRGCSSYYNAVESMSWGQKSNVDVPIGPFRGESFTG
jgi:hypothetical protein